MRHPASIACVWLVALFGVACGGPDLSAEVAEYVGYRLDEGHFFCQCPDDLGFEGYGECVDSFGEADEDEQACMADVLSAEGNAGKEYIDCLIVAWSAERECLTANPGCEPGWDDGCAADRTAAVKTCTQVDQDVRIAFSLCDID